MEQPTQQELDKWEEILVEHKPARHPRTLPLRVEECVGTEKPTNKMPSKTQAAFERRDISALTRIGIRKCLDLHPPVSTDSRAENFTHAHKRYRTNRYAWIEKWIAWELDHPRENDTGARLMTRLRWRLIDEIRKEYATKRRVVKAFDKWESERVVERRVHREKLPSREKVLDFLSTLDPPQDPILRDLWERIIDTYPDWRLSTNRHLAAVYGVHPNVIASRRSALAVLYVDDCDELSSEQAFIVKHCLRLRAGVLRKTDIMRVEAEKGVFHRDELVGKLRKVGMVRRMDWRHGSHKGSAEGMPQFTPLYNCLEPESFTVPRRCPHVENGKQCIYTQAKCPFHGDKRAI